jgi:capsular polysaccharide transport system permease protein
MTSDNGDGESTRLRHFTRLNLRGAYRQIVDDARQNVADLADEELLIVANAAAQMRAVEVLRVCVHRLVDDIGPETDVLELWMRLAMLANDPAEARGAIAAMPEGAEVGVSKVAAQLSQRLVAWHAWGAIDELLTKCAPLEGSEQRMLIARAVLHLRRRDYTNALLTAEKALDTAPKVRKRDMRFLVARINEALGDVRAAAYAYARAVDQQSLPARILYRGARAALHDNRVELAQRLIRRARAADAAGCAVDYVDGMVDLAYERTDEAYGKLERAYKQWPGDPRLARGWFRAYELSTTGPQALTTLEELIRQLDDPGLKAERVQLLRALDRTDDADAALEEALCAHPEHPELLALRDSDGAEGAVPGSAVATRDEVQVAQQLSSEAADPKRQSAQLRELPDEFKPMWSDRDLRAADVGIQTFKIQARVIQALILREIRTRFGRRKLGYLWALLEPALHTGTLYLIWSFRDRGSMDGLPLLIFLITGFIPFFTFTGTYGQVSNAIRSNKALLAHRPVTVFDVVMARAILELATRIAVFTIFMTGTILIGYEIELLNPLHVFAALPILWLGGIALGLVVQSLVPIFASLPTLMGAVIRVLYFTSGVIFPISMLPSSLQEILLWNPLVHLIAKVRFSFTEFIPLDGVTFTYPVAVTVGSLLIALMMMRVMQSRALAA